MSLSMWLRHRFPVSMTYHRLFCEFHSICRKHSSSKEKNYYEFSINVGPGAPLNDAPLNFYIRCILEKKYTNVIEIGAYDGRRVIQLKKLFPEVQFYGLDILQNYQESFSLHNVEFHYLDIDFLSEQQFHKNTLLLSQGTMCCIPHDFMKEMFGRLRENSIDVALVEPALIYSFRADFVRRSNKSRYYNYKRLLPQWGYEPVALEGKHHYRPAMGELRTYCYCVPKGVSSLDGE